MADTDFERAKVCYEQNNQQMRLLSEQMNRVPTISITLTGGLWFGASQTAQVDSKIRFALFLFAGVANIGLALSCFRIRDVIESYFERIKEFSPEHFASGRPIKPRLQKFSRYSMITVYVTLMSVAAMLSFIAAFGFYWPFGEWSRLIGIATLIFLLIVVSAKIFEREATQP